MSIKTSETTINLCRECSKLAAREYKVLTLALYLQETQRLTSDNAIALSENIIDAMQYWDESWSSRTKYADAAFAPASSHYMYSWKLEHLLNMSDEDFATLIHIRLMATSHIDDSRYIDYPAIVENGLAKKYAVEEPKIRNTRHGI